MLILLTCAIIMSTGRASSVFLLSYRNMILTNQLTYFLRAVF